MNIGFVSTRFAGTDGVSLEANKWADAFSQIGYDCYWFAGELDQDEAIRFLVPEAHFKHDDIDWINQRIIGSIQRDATVTEEIRRLRSLLRINLQQRREG